MHEVNNKKTTHSKELDKLKKGYTFKTMLSTKSKKINRITNLADRIETEEKEYDCAECL